MRAPSATRATPAGATRRATARDTGFPTSLFLEIDHAPGARIRQQLETALRDQIRQGRLRAGAKLPPSRTLARELGVARSVIVEVYGQLVAEGLIEAIQGAGTCVRADATPVANELRPAARASANTAFATGLPDPAYFPQREWMRAYNSIFKGPTSQPLGRPDPRGRSELRTALADHLSRVRGLRTSPSRLLICNGVSQALAHLACALRKRGVTRIGVEDPCPASARNVFSSCGVQPMPIPVDSEGLLVPKLRQAGVGAVLVSPAHSFPTGAVLSQARRRALVQWARETDALIIEDDEDAEFRFERTPVGALQGLAPENVVYAGSASKVLDPALRIGWISTPQRLAHDLIAAKVTADAATETFGQLALTHFVEDGGLARQIRRVRPRYRVRRDRLLDELQAQLPELAPQGCDVGLHLFLPLPPDAREPDVIEAAKRDGLHLEGTAQHWADPAGAVPAVLVGYGTLRESAVERDVRTLASAILEPRPSRAPTALQRRTAA